MIPRAEKNASARQTKTSGLLQILHGILMQWSINFPMNFISDSMRFRTIPSLSTNRVDIRLKEHAPV